MDDRTRWEAQVRAVPWASLADEPADGADIEPLLLRLWDAEADPNEIASLYWKVYRLVVDQGATFETSIVVARLLIAFVAEEKAPHKDQALLLLTRIALGDEDAVMDQRQSVEGRRRELARQTHLLTHPDDVDEDEQRWDPPLVKAEQIFLDAYDAVREGVPIYIGLLGSDDLRIQLRASALLGWFPEERRRSIAPLVGLVEGTANPWVRGTAAVALGMLAEPDDPEVERVLLAVLHGGSPPERWSGCIGLAQMLSEPSDEIVDRLYDCIWEARGQTFPWGFLDGDISEFAKLVAAGLPESTAAAQVAALVRRLPSPEPLTEDAVVRMLLAAAIGATREPASLNFLELPPVQAGALGAIGDMLLRSGADDHPNLLMLLQSYGIPVSDLYTYRTWSTGRSS
jgi:hypothetical protein